MCMPVIDAHNWGQDNTIATAQNLTGQGSVILPSKLIESVHRDLFNAGLLEPVSDAIRNNSE